MLLFATLCFFLGRKQFRQNLNIGQDPVVLSIGEEEEGEYDGARERNELEIEKTKDPALGYIPADRLLNAIRYTDNLKKARLKDATALTWTERGPIFDSVGPTNGNTRGSFAYTSGYMTAVLVDTLNDPTGNTVLIGGTSGGVWKCTNFLSAVPNWHAINDTYQTLAIASICQDPTSPNTMYFSTGDGTYGSSSILGGGIWKSTNGGDSWTKLSSSANFYRSFKIVCDAAGNVYAGLRADNVPVVQRFGLFRSKDHGTSWDNITPELVGSNDSSCTDIEISSTGRLHASFGADLGRVKHWYTDDPANVTTTTGWNASTGIRTSSVAAIRMELACIGTTLYAVTVNASANGDSCYKSIDGGVTWTKQNTAAFPAGILSGQGQYNITLAINPVNTDQIILGGLDAWKSYNGGQSFTKQLSFWVTTAPYVHADHHFMQWWMVGAESRVVIGSDGGIFLSQDSGNTWSDRNRNLNIKQFYSGSIHPDAGSPIIIGGAQDNGSHQLKTAGLTYSYEVTGGDGCFSHINQANPLIQFTSYIRNQYRRSVDGGLTFANTNISTSGFFVNPFDYDDGQNIMYACNTTNSIYRWANANVSAPTSAVAVTSASFLGAPSAFKVSPYTPNRVYIGTNTAKVLRLDNANTVTSGTVAANLTNITGASFPSAGFVNCVNVGSSDQYLVAVLSNFGVNNVWYSNDGGTSWSAIDGTLPDMPIRWAVFDPSDDNQLYIATMAGVYHTDAVNGSSTVWVPEPGLPTVRTDMLKVRMSDNTLLAATYGRGMYTAVIPSPPQVRFSTPSLSVTEATTNTIGCRGYKDYTVNVSMVAPPTGDATVTYSVNGGNTASAGSDFDFTTNGDFTSSSNQHLFSSGVAQTKTITVRIYDDAQMESTETFTLSFAITGTTDASPGSLHTFTFNILDNDAAPATSAAVTATVGQGNIGLSQPFRRDFTDARTQCLYLASELKAAGLSAGTITAIAFQVTTKASTVPFTGMTIKMKNTSTTTLPGGGVAFEEGSAVVFGPVDFTTAAGLNTITLSTPFVWDGISNVLVDLCFDNSTTGTSDIVASTSTGTSLCHFTRQSIGGSGCSFTNALTVFNPISRPDLRFTMTLNLVATALSTSKTEYLAPNNDLYFYAPSGEILARIRSLSPFNYGCTQLEIDRAGTGATLFWNNNNENKLMDKTFHVVPTSNSAMGQYEITLYYSQAEKAGWEAATGQSWNNIQLIKVAGQISQVTPANRNGAGAIEIVTPTRGTLGPHYTLTYTFNSGFSGFGAGVAGFALPVQLLDFTGRLQSNSVVLNWKTSLEINSKRFEIERSYDGQNFTKIGTVAAAGNSSFIKDYQFTDKMIAQDNNYYRLKQIDIDDKFEYSKTVLIRYALDGKKPFSIMRNPFTTTIDMQFLKVPDGKLQIRLFTTSGQLLKSWNEATLSYNRLRLDVSDKPITAGVYILRVRVNGQEFVERVMKE